MLGRCPEDLSPGGQIEATRVPRLDPAPTANNVNQLEVADSCKPRGILETHSNSHPGHTCTERELTQK